VSATGTRVPAGWHADPGDPSTLRWWDGLRWTTWVYGPEGVTEAALPHLGDEEPEDRRVALPGSALGLTLLAVVWSIALAVGGNLLADAVGLSTDAEQTAFASVGLYSGLVLGCLAVRARYGTDRGFAVDFGIHYRRGDWAKGLVGSFAARGGGGLLGAIVALILYSQVGDHNRAAPDTGTSDPTVAFLVVFAVVAVLVAPLIEELFFRGLLLRVLEGVVHPTLALLIQAVLFGAAHLRPEYGWENLIILAVIGFGGLVLGWLAQRYRRLGPGMACHAWFNLYALVVTLALVLGS
jgi:membrane protease YdiL (CAAX protease family)